MIGPNGAGKTTVFNLISGFFHPNEGQILFCGRNISRSAPHNTARLGIGRTFQIVKPLPNLTVLENAMLGGAGTLIGPIIGAVLLLTASEVFKNQFKESHLLIYGVLIVLVVLFLPECSTTARRSRKGNRLKW